MTRAPRVGVHFCAQDPIFSNNKLPDGNEPGYPGRRCFSCSSCRKCRAAIRRGSLGVFALSFAPHHLASAPLLTSGGIFDPFGWSKGDLKSLKTKEIKNGRLAMLAFAGKSAALRPLLTGCPVLDD